MTIASKKDPALRQFNSENLRKKMGGIEWSQAGRVTDVVGTVVEATLPKAQVGMVCDIRMDGGRTVLAEVVGFKDDKALLLPFANLTGISAGAWVRRRSVMDSALVGDHLLGKIIDPFMNPLTENTQLLPAPGSRTMQLENTPPNPMERARISTPISLGVRCIDALLTVGEGQRMGIFAGSGVGKSVLMGMIARGCEADCNVIGLIGERGREVREFLDKELGPDGLKKSVVIAATSDQSPLTRIRAARLTMAVAEYFSGAGKRVLLMMDSLTRVAQAQREIGLAIGEPPTTKGYPPSIFSLLPRLLERCGTQPSGKGSISGMFTVLVDGDDFNDPVPDTARAILDGHIQLSRSLAAKGHFPAIDTGNSISRVMPDIVTPEHRRMATHVKSLISTYDENYDFLQLGTYTPGHNPVLDEAVQRMGDINLFLRQDMAELSSLDQSVQLLEDVTDTSRLVDHR